jgi:hypothetical protein
LFTARKRWRADTPFSLSPRWFTCDDIEIGPEVRFTSLALLSEFSRIDFWDKLEKGSQTGYSGRLIVFARGESAMERVVDFSCTLEGLLLTAGPVEYMSSFCRDNGPLLEDELLILAWAAEKLAVFLHSRPVHEEIERGAGWETW